MLLFFICAFTLIAGYFTYGKFIDRVFKPDYNRTTPAIYKADGIDYVQMPRWRIIMIQLLNIAGVGPIFGPILGALYGPIALVWIVIGSIFAGAVHDYFSGMLSIRHDGASISEIIGEYLGMPAKWIMRLFSIVLLILVGVVFVKAPADLLTKAFGVKSIFGLPPANFFVILIFTYYFIATILPIDKIIGRLYPFFGALLIIMTFVLIIALFLSGKPIFPNMSLKNVHPSQLPVWPLLFITISCGALSGFHCTQSPLMARCISNEYQGRSVFFGSMILEGIIALIWATIGMSFFYNPVDGAQFSSGLNAVLTAGGPANVVATSSTALLGVFGGFLAMMAVIVLPITSGDTAFRSTRLIFADAAKISQKNAINRLALAVPIFVVGIILTQVDFNVIWRYFGFSNQTLAATMLWTGAAYLMANAKPHWICSLPATFMTAVVITYIAYQKIGFGLPIETATIIGIAASLILLGLFIRFGKKIKPAIMA